MKILMLLIIMLCGCSTTTQKAEIRAFSPITKLITEEVELEVTKTSLLHWSKFQADTSTFGMEAKVYNAESRPDAEAIESIVNSKVLDMLTILMGGGL